MSEVTANEVVAALNSAKNLNAAVKSLLKKDARNGVGFERLAKDLRTAASNPERLKGFIERHFPKNETFFLVVAGHAFPDLIAVTADAVVTKHAETFNATYEKTATGLNVTDRAKFEEILRDVRSMIEAEQSKAAIGKNAYLEKATLTAIFDADVLPKVLEVVQTTSKAA